jgi:hypothetical protein
MCDKHASWGPTPWQALLKSYGIHLFSATPELIPFAEAFHRHRKNSVRSKEIQNLFQSLRRLGLVRVGHLSRLSFQEIQKRWGKAQAEWWRGVTQPEGANWIWIPYRQTEPLEWKGDLEEPSIDALQIKEFIAHGLNQLISQSKRIAIDKISIRLHLSDPEEIIFSFAHSLILPRDRAWLLHLVEERLNKLCLDGSVWRVHLLAHPVVHESRGQLSLFSQESNQVKQRELLEKLENKNIFSFVPLWTPSALPEDSWKKASALQHTFDPKQGWALSRPLYQEPPRMRRQPEGVLDFLERITWHDAQGRLVQRDYYKVRDRRAWRWIFKNQSEQWFEQGVIE